MEWVDNLQHLVIFTVMEYYYWKFLQEKNHEIFEGDMGIHKLISMALPNHVMDIIDPSLLSKQEDDDRDHHEISTNDETSIRRRDMEPNVLAMMEDWLVSVLQIGVSCSSTSPSERIPMPVVVNKLQAIRNSYLKFHNLQ
ncbi:hypothetical protein RIF29_18982 [Crotalaria pallida]